MLRDGDYDSVDSIVKKAMHVWSKRPEPETFWDLQADWKCRRCAYTNRFCVYPCYMCSLLHDSENNTLDARIPKIKKKQDISMPKRATEAKHPEVQNVSEQINGATPLDDKPTAKTNNNDLDAPTPKEEKQDISIPKRETKEANSEFAFDSTKPLITNLHIWDDVYTRRSSITAAHSVSNPSQGRFSSTRENNNNNNNDQDIISMPKRTMEKGHTYFHMTEPYKAMYTSDSPDVCTGYFSTTTAAARSVSSSNQDRFSGSREPRAAAAGAATKLTALRADKALSAESSKRTVYQNKSVGFVNYASYCFFNLDHYLAFASRYIPCRCHQFTALNSSFKIS